MFNEASGIAAVIDEWTLTLDGLGLDYELLAFDDGSTDDTYAALEAKARTHPRLRLARHSNRGHGPTILRGYRTAVGSWVAQTDSDGEIPAGAFSSLWDCRHRADLILGSRSDRKSAVERRLVSACSRTAVRLLFGRAQSRQVTERPRANTLDVNTPFRLMRREALEHWLEFLNADVFAPNVALTGLALRDDSVHQVPVPHHGRQWGTDSLGQWKLWRVAAKSLRQTVGVARAVRRQRTSTSAAPAAAPNERGDR